MQPMWLELTLDTFQVCSVPGCDKDATVDIEAQVSGELQYYAGACPKHDQQIASAMRVISNGTAPEKLAKQNQLALEELFVAPPTYSKKCKYLAWKLYRQTGSSVAPTDPGCAASSRPLQDTVVTAKPGWTWVTNRDRWRTTEGQSVPLRQVKLAELLSAAVQIRQVNFPITTPRGLSWTKKLPPPSVGYTYQDDRLDVGSKLAKEKLEDFCDQLLARGLVK